MMRNANYLEFGDGQWSPRHIFLFFQMFLGVLSLLLLFEHGHGEEFVLTVLRGEQVERVLRHLVRLALTRPLF